MEKPKAKEDGSHSRLRRSFVQGAIKLFILQQAAQGAVYGRELGKSLGILGYELSPGTLYPFLHGLEKERLLRSRNVPVSGRVRRYYELTDDGHACLLEVREELNSLVKKIFSMEEALLRRRAL
ncbi:MAG: PadR family transcriptional regulator [Candidatus Binatia bacterium]